MCLSRRRPLLPILLAILGACEAPPVHWEADERRRVSGDVILDVTGTTIPAGNDDVSSFASLPSAHCEGSAKIARLGKTVNVVWWSPRPDSSARLEFARSVDGGEHWIVHSPVDTTDQGVSGCKREPPSIATDSASGYVHVSYGLVGAEGPGLFFSHSMDNGALFHAPVPIVYGERLGITSVAASGDNVAIAFEDPNSSVPRIGLALSRTMGHIFEHRVLPVNDRNGLATHPMVAVRGTRLAVAWREHTSPGGESDLRVRSGLLH